MLSPSISINAAEPVAEIYRDAELRILARISEMLADGIADDSWELVQLARLQAVRQEVVGLLAQANPAAAAALVDSLNEVYAAGNLSAYSDVGKALPELQTVTVAQQSAVAALATDVTAAFGSAQPSILRAVDDVYRRVVQNAATEVLTGTTTRVEAAQGALDRLLGQGLRGIETKRGVMSLDTYVTMAVRTATARAAVQGHLDGQDELGLDLVTIQPGPRACDICDRWARLVLTRRTQTGRLELESVTDGKPVVVVVDDTLAAARAAGWGHPNCRCNIGAYLPGVTKPADLERPPWDEDAYKAQQRQRAIERQIRGYKTREALALTPEGKAAARGKVKEWQAAQRSHLAANPYLKRQSAREQIAKGMPPLQPRATGQVVPVPRSPRDQFNEALAAADSHEGVASALRERFGPAGIEVEGFDKPGKVSLHEARTFARVVHGLVDDFPELERVGKIALRPVPRNKTVAAFVEYAARSKDLDRRASINLSTTFDSTTGAPTMEGAFKAAAERGWTHIAPDTSGLEHVITHEVGHLLDLATGQVTRGQVKRLRTKYATPGSDVSGYGKTDPAEAIAEAFATTRLSGEIANPAERAISDYLLAKLEQRRKAARAE